ncbi:MAG: protein kinase [Planctomycetes bacterium]|nr:protein kinase [Planctomycetota bacterium]
MPNEFRCPQCREMIAVEDGKEGEPVQCPFCHGAITAIPHDTPTLAPGEPGEDAPPKQLGDYEIIEPLGEGGMGVVYKAKHLRLDRTVALKLLPARFTRSGGQHVERFLREARAAAQLEHVNVVGIHAVGEAEGRHFIEMQYVEGKTLAQVIVQRGCLPLDQAVPIVKNVARALAAAHAKGIIHRDIKPDNIMIDPQGTVKVMDFGLAHSEAASAITGDGQVIGTPLYMSPEQCDGKPADARSDIYSLGATFYKMLTGKPPFTGETPLAVMRQHADTPLPSVKAELPDVPEAVCAVVQKMLAKNPDDRFQNCEELISVIDGACKARPTEEEEFEKRGKAQAILALITLLVIGGLAIHAWLTGDLEISDVDSLSPEAGAPRAESRWDPREFARGLIGDRRRSILARTIRVAQDGTRAHRAISNAVARARPGDVIEICDSATYREAVVLAKPNLCLKAAKGQTPTVDAERGLAHCIVIQEGGKGAVIEGVRCVRATNDGILVEPGADDVVLFGNTCAENRWGIRIKGDRAIVLVNTAADNESYGIQLWESERSQVADNRCRGNSSGIDVNKSRYCVVAGNILHANRKSGMQCRDSEGISINGNVFHKCEGDGIDLDASNHVEILNNIIAFCTGAGISFGDQCIGLKAHHNDIFACNTLARRGRKYFRDLGAWVAAEQGRGSLSADPLFRDPPSDFSLDENSPCRGKGSDRLDLGALQDRSGLERQILRPQR